MKIKIGTVSLEMKPLEWEPCNEPGGYLKWGTRDPFGTLWWAKDNGSNAPDEKQKSDVEMTVVKQMENCFV